MRQQKRILQLDKLQKPKTLKHHKTVEHGAAPELELLAANAEMVLVGAVAVVPVAAAVVPVAVTR